MTKLRFILLATLAFGLGFATATQVLATGSDEASGVSSRTGNESPRSGLSTGESNSRIDDYSHQDEQINIQGDKDAVVKVLRVNQKNLVNDYVVGVFPVTNVNPKEIRALFRAITAKEGGRAEVIRDKVSKKAYLQVVCPRFQLPYIEQAISALDEAWLQEDVDGATELYYKAKFRGVENINRIADVPGGSDGGTTVVDKAANAIFKRGEPYRMDKWMETAEQVDVLPPQLLLQAAVYEVEVTNEQKLGLDYVAWKCGPGSNLFRFVTWGFHSSQEAKNATSIFDPFVAERTLVAGTDDIGTSGHGYYAAANFLLTSEYIDFLVRNGRARLVTTGRVNVRHGEFGVLDMTDEVIHFTREQDESDLASEADKFADAGSEEGTARGPEDFVERCRRQGSVNVGFTMEVEPFIGLETTELGYVLFVTNIVGVTPAGTPITRTSATTGNVLLRDGTPICAGGLKRTEEVKSTAKMPILGSIPVLGWLFGGEQEAQRQTEMVVVLTPQVVQFSEIDKELASQEDKSVRAQVAQNAALRLPKSEFGFDQWLLGRDY